MAKLRTWCRVHQRWHGVHVIGHERLRRCPAMPARPCPDPGGVKLALRKIGETERQEQFLRRAWRRMARRKRTEYLKQAQAKTQAKYSSFKP